MRKPALLLLGVGLIVVGLIGMLVSGVFTGRGTSCFSGGSCFGTRTPEIREPLDYQRRGPVVPEGSQVPQESASGIDAMFIVQMIPHHEDAIAMAELALTRAEHPEIKQLAEDVIRTQSAEIEQMRGWYLDWYGESVPQGGGSFGMMGGGMMGGAFGDLESLRDAEQFDQAFIEQMVPHHEMGIMMARMAGNATNRPEIEELTDSINASQSDEVARMRKWYQDWYGR
ncbi:MAG: DUF305 domain-containing protein [Coriobacteriia bacterium]